MADVENDLLQAALRRATEVLGSEDNAKEWLRTPQVALSSKSPTEMLIDEVGLSKVLNLLGAIADGGYL